MNLVANSKKGPPSPFFFGLMAQHSRTDNPRLLHLLTGCAYSTPMLIPLSCYPTGRASQPQNEENAMLKYAIIFALISLVAGALGFTGVAAGAAGIAKVLFVVFLILTLIFVVLAFKAAGAVSRAIK